jgi:hypothetical protein
MTLSESLEKEVVQLLTNIWQQVVDEQIKSGSGIIPNHVLLHNDGTVEIVEG